VVDKACQILQCMLVIYDKDQKEDKIKHFSLLWLTLFSLKEQVKERWCLMKI